MSLFGRQQRGRESCGTMDEPGERIGPCRVDGLHEGLTLGPFRTPIAFTIQRCAVEIRTSEDHAFGSREVERGQQVCGRGETLYVRKVL